MTGFAQWLKLGKYGTGCSQRLLLARQGFSLFLSVERSVSDSISMSAFFFLPIGTHAFLVLEKMVEIVFMPILPVTNWTIL
jgi:hypothetical protein